MGTEVLEQYAQLLETGHRTKLQLQRMVEAHQNALLRLSTADLELQSAKVAAKKALQEHMQQLQSKLNQRYKQATKLLEQEFELQQLPLQSSMQLLNRSVSALELSALKINSGLQPSPSQSVRWFTAVMQDIHMLMQQGQAAVEQSGSQAASISQQGFPAAAWQQFLKLRVKSKESSSSSSSSRSRSPKIGSGLCQHEQQADRPRAHCAYLDEAAHCPGDTQQAAANRGVKQQQEVLPNCHAARSQMQASRTVGQICQQAAQQHYRRPGSYASSSRQWQQQQYRPYCPPACASPSRQWQQQQQCRPCCPPNYSPDQHLTSSWRSAPSPAQHRVQPATATDTHSQSGAQAGRHKAATATVRWQQGCAASAGPNTRLHLAGCWLQCLQL